jgi:hypothetical protein
MKILAEKYSIDKNYNSNYILKLIKQNKFQLSFIIDKNREYLEFTLLLFFGIQFIYYIRNKYFWKILNYFSITKLYRLVTEISIVDFKLFWYWFINEYNIKKEYSNKRYYFINLLYKFCTKIVEDSSIVREKLFVFHTNKEYSIFIQQQNIYIDYYFYWFKLSKLEKRFNCISGYVSITENSNSFRNLGELEFHSMEENLKLNTVIEYFIETIIEQYETTKPFYKVYKNYDSIETVLEDLKNIFYIEESKKDLNEEFVYLENLNDLLDTNNSNLSLLPNM